MVEGRHMLEVDGHPHLLGPGDSVMAPRGVPHTWALDGTEPGRIVIAFQPAGLMDELFDAACQLSGMASPEALRPLFEAHGMQVVGPPLR
ncbi:MAG TPA: cupin domain-containing protein [Trueperaceae bacterium]|nr:cupin domain-containing protein [Trueperaceae bacterium]